MEGAAITNAAGSAATSVLRSANRQPELAGALIAKTMQALQQSKLADPAKSVATVTQPAEMVGTNIDIRV